jgi:hypothetical protein
VNCGELDDTEAVPTPTSTIGFRPRSSPMRSGCITDSLCRFAILKSWLLRKVWWSATKLSAYGAVKFGAEFAKRLRPHRRPLGRRWFVDEVFTRNNGTIHYRWASRRSQRQELFPHYPPSNERSARQPLGPIVLAPECRSLIGFTATLPHFRVCCPTSNTNTDAGSITGRKTLLSPHVNSNGACVASSLPSKPSSSSPFTVRSVTNSDLDVIASVRVATELYASDGFALEYYGASHCTRPA